jgi:NhaP-type Na+/H+ or K+/H+ antiporter
MRKYVEANISDKSETTIKYVMKMMASATEAIIFMYLGSAAVSSDHVWNTPFILLTLTFCLVYRVVGKFSFTDTHLQIYSTRRLGSELFRSEMVLKRLDRYYCTLQN